MSAKIVQQLMKNRARLVSGLVSLLAVLPLAPCVDASLPRTSTERAPEPIVPTVASEPAELSVFSLFAGDELTRALDARARRESFHPLAALEEKIYPKTRIGGFDLFGGPLVGVEPTLSREQRWGYEHRWGKSAEGFVYPLQDELGNVERLTDATGGTLERYEYEGYGKFKIFSPTNAALSTSAYAWKWLFQGREYQTNLSAYDFRARTLWPELGRWGQEDPLGYRDSANLYQGFGARWPLVSDPRGLEWTYAAQAERQELATDIARFASAKGHRREMIYVRTTKKHVIENPNDPEIRALPEQAYMSYSLRNVRGPSYGRNWDGQVLVELQERLRSFEAAWGAANPRAGDNVWLDEDSQRFHLFDRQKYLRSYGIQGLVGLGAGAILAAGAGAIARSQNGGVAELAVPDFARSEYGRLSPTERGDTLTEYPVCVYCGKRSSTQVDHVEALKEDWIKKGFEDDFETRSGRANAPGNRVGACQPCNGSKGARGLGAGPGEWWPTAWPQGAWWPFGGPP